MNMSTKIIARAALLGLAFGMTAKAQTTLLNASYDVGREIYAAINTAFVPYWKEKTGQDVRIDQSHAGSSAQAQAILQGLQADVVTFNQVNDVVRLVEGGLIQPDWNTRFPHGASPFYSIHAILVRRGNPKGIKDWDDLTKPGVEIVQVNPKTGGNGRYAVLAYYGYALDKFGGDEAAANDFLKNILANVVIFERGGRAATTAFTERQTGDVLVTFESEVLQLAADPNSPYEAVIPSSSVLSEFPVAVVDHVAGARGTVEIAKGYLEFLYTPSGQEIIAQNFYRPRDADTAARHADRFPPVNAFEVDERFGSAASAQAKFFDNNALVDRLLGEIGARR
ncbi:MAG TPA: sulfate ABC transporter substrate-binding protein [Kiritimatiellia bacterium]|nr:sulfate ABC transporter substrate-binding protein [Kiritimatiellia bacterium]